MRESHLGWVFVRSGSEDEYEDTLFEPELDICCIRVVAKILPDQTRPETACDALPINYLSSTVVVDPSCPTSIVRCQCSMAQRLSLASAQAVSAAS